MWNGYHLSIEGIRKGNLFREKWYMKGLGVGPPGGASQYKKLLSTLGPWWGGRLDGQFFPIFTVDVWRLLKGNLAQELS